MFRNLKYGRLGRYYSTVTKKYGSITPIATALLLFIVICAINEFKLFSAIAESSTVNGITIAALVIAGVVAVYYAVTKMICDKVNAIDFAMLSGAILALLMLVGLIFMSSSVGFIVTFVVELLLVLIFTIARAAVVKPSEIEKVSANANVTFVTYFKALAEELNLFMLAVIGIAIFAIVLAFDGAGLVLSENFVISFAIAVACLIVSMMCVVPGRISSKKIGQVDAFLWIFITATILYAVALAMNFTVLKLVIWLVAIGVLAIFAILVGKNTYYETKHKEIENGKRGFKIYFTQLAGKYNLILASLFGLLGFIVLYSLVGIDVFFGLNTATSTGFHIALDALVLIGFAALLLSARSRRVNGCDMILFALSVFSVLSLIPTIQFFAIYKIVIWLMLIVLIAVTFCLRVVSVREEQIDVKEIYNPKHIFNKYNVQFVAANVKTFFIGDTKDSHYISRKESRNISRSNMRIIKEYENRKRRKNVPESEYITKMRDDRNIVEFENLHTYFFSDAGVVKAVNGVSFDIPQGSTVGVIGESGCGKSVTSLSLMQLVQAPKGQVMEGSEIRFKSTVIKKDENGNPIPVYQAKLDENGNEIKDENGNVVYETAPKIDKKGRPVLDKDGNPIIETVQKRDANGIPLFETEEKVYNVAKMPTEVMRNIRGREITMIFQEPMTSLNPIFTIGNQLDEVVFLHVPGATKESAKARTFEMLRLVGIIPENVYDRYPHELSGGMRQRVMIAMALSCHPKLIIADEPTTALDVTIQAQILDLLRDIKSQINGSIMFITHDLGVIAEMADFVVVMYAGRIIEKGTAKEVFDNPLHPYTKGLQKSKPALNKKVDRLYSIPGNVPNPIDMPDYCYFRDRCSMRCEKCSGKYPEKMVQVSPTHFVACHLYDQEDVSNGNN